MHSTPGYHNRAASSYARQAVENSAPLGLVARLYELAIVDVARARAALAAENWAAKGAAVRRVGEYLSLLQCSLSLEQGGVVAANLDRIYTYLLVRLSEAHVANDDAIFEEIGKHLSELGAAWQEAAREDAQQRGDSRKATETAAAAAAP